jgi:hypothetical protein
MCSHQTSYRLWSESLLYRKRYPAKLCRTWEDFKSRRCDYNPTNYMGFDAIRGLEGTFFNQIRTEPNAYAAVNIKPNFVEYVLTGLVERNDFSRHFKRLFKSFA